MIQRIQSQVVRSYLRELETALSGVPPEVVTEIVAEIAEELASLDAATAAARIKELGDPTFIAAEVKAAVDADPSEAAASQAATVPPAHSLTRTGERWYLVAASLLVALGGILIPVLGWIAGIVMVWLSPSWWVWEKWVGTLAPFAIAAGLMGGSFLARGVAPGSLTGWHFAILSIFVSPFLTGMWLLWRGLRR